MSRIATIVEGHGDVAALPILLRRIAAHLGTAVDIPRPIRVKRQQILKAGELERAVELAALRAKASKRILILLDADQDCPKNLAPKLLHRATVVRPDNAIRVVLPKTEYEAWFLAAADSIAGQRGIDSGATAPAQPESIRNAKGWLSKRMPPGRPYSETLDQPALTAAFDLKAARAAPSFEKLWRDVVWLLEWQPR